MNRRGTGAVFCLIAAILFIGRYIAAAIFMSNLSSWDANLFSAGLEYVGALPGNLSMMSLITGIVYLVLAERNKEK